MACTDIGKIETCSLWLVSISAAPQCCLLRQNWSRGQVEARLANIPPCLVGIEACVRAHHPNRRLKALGRDACPTSRSDRIKGGPFEPPLLQKPLLTKVPATVFATEPGSGLTDEAVAGGIPAIVAAVVAVIVGVRTAER